MTVYGSSVGDLLASKLRDPHALKLVLPEKAMAELTFPGVDPALVVEQVRGSIPKLLDVSFGEVLAGAWSKLAELHEFRGPSGGHGEVALAEHTVEANYRPTLTVRVNQVPLRSIELDLQLKVELQALVLKVDGGKIRDVLAGDFRLVAALLWKEHEIISPLRTEAAPLGPCVHVGDGIAIP